MHDFLIELSPLGCVALAFLPVVAFGLAGALFSPHVPSGNDALLTSVLRICGGALVFVAAFMVTNLWMQANTYLEEVTTEYAAGWDLDEAARAAVTAADADRMTTALRVYREAVTATEIGLHVPPEGSPAARGRFAEVEAQAVELGGKASSRRSALGIDRAMSDLAAARAQRVEYPELAGLPGVIIITIMLLAWVAAFLLGLFPGSGHRWVKAMQIVTAVFVVGLVQVSVFYLATRAGMFEVIQYALQI